jgi:hypothetical protein
MAAVPAGLLTVPFIENINKFQNPFRRPVATTVFLIGAVSAVRNWCLFTNISLTLGLFINYFFHRITTYDEKVNYHF